MDSIWCDSQVIEMPEGDAISYTMKPTRLYKADEVMKIVKRVIEHGLCHKLNCSARKGVHTYKCDCGLYELWAELEKIAGGVRK